MDARDLVISADGHVNETSAFWQRVPEALRERNDSSFEEHPDGVLLKVLGDTFLMPMEIVTGRTDEDRQREFRSEPSGGTDLALRRANQAADGVHAEPLGRAGAAQR